MTRSVVMPRFAPLPPITPRAVPPEDTETPADEMRRRLKAAERETRRRRVKQDAMEAVETLDVRNAHRAVIGAAAVFAKHGRYRDARTLLLSALTVALKMRFAIATGKGESGDIGIAQLAKKLRSCDAISKRDLDTIRRLAVVDGINTVYDAKFVAELSALTRAALQSGLQEWEYKGKPR